MRRNALRLLTPYELRITALVAVALLRAVLAVA